MSTSYTTIQWSDRKKKYDFTFLALMILYLVAFIGLQLFFNPLVSIETLIIRATGTLAFLMLHIILAIGPLSRINNKFLPLLYNRRHLGVTMFLIALIHGIFNLLMFHAMGDTDPISSLFTANPNYDSFRNFPFQVLGFFGLLILFAMAASSHDFWLKTLSAKVWKTLHRFVYLAYILIVGHVLLGVGVANGGLSSIFVIVGVALLAIVHIVARRKTNIQQLERQQLASDGFYKVCQLQDIQEDRAKIVQIEGEPIAIYKYKGQLSAVHNVCKHQGGPLGEGKIVDGCITCPWHGYQYFPHNGQSPPPFTEKLATYDVRVVGNEVLVNPTPYPEGTERPTASFA